MSYPFRSNLVNILHNDLDVIRNEKSIKLDGIVSDEANSSEFIEIIIEFVKSLRPQVDIERLSLQDNRIAELPRIFFHTFKNLKYLNLHNNNITTLPDDFGLLEKLEVLDLSSNSLLLLSSSTLNLKRLTVLSLKNNRLKYLPPALGELQNLSLLETSENPLLLPSAEFIKSLQKSNDSDWVMELKAYIRDISSVLEGKINDLTEDITEDNNRYTPNPIARSKSVSETRSKSSKAARRMGLIIKKSEESSGNLSTEELDKTNKFEPEYSSTLLPKSASAAETSFNIVSPPPPIPPISTITTTTPSTAPTSRPISPTNHLNTAQSSNPNLLSTRPSSRNRSRSNTLKEIDRILDKNENVDTEHKSGAYFRRLSTLQEVPNDEFLTSSRTPSMSTASSTSHSTTTRRENTGFKRNILKDQQITEEDGQAPQNVSHERTLSGNSLPKVSSSNKRSLMDSSDIIKVSRKVLFSFSELHSSVRRFTGFCVDKKVTMKMVSFLYTTKSNIDSLVENLEIMEESGNNMDHILDSLSSSISSFKSIMVLLSENFSKFVVKIDVCFIRMLYLTLYGSFNELLNAYNILSQTKAAQPNFMTNSSEAKQKAANINDFDEMDEKLYKSIEIATKNAEEVFTELGNVVTKSASNVALNSSIRSKVKDLSSVCLISMDITKRLKIKLITINNNPSQPTRKSFWDDINLFLKAIIQTFSAVKAIMKDLPALNEIRAAMATLTKSTKDVTIMLDVSSYRSMSSESSNSSNQPSQLISVPSSSNLFTPFSAFPSQQSYNLPLVNPAQGNGNLNPARSHMGSNAFNIHLENSANESSPLASPPINSVDIGNPGPFTAPVNSSAQYFERNGMNPFDGLIMAVNSSEREREKELNAKKYEY